MLTGTNLFHAKEHNLRIVHETIRLHGPLSRADIARRTELTPQTVSNLIRQLLDSELVLETDRLHEGRGAPSIQLEMNSEAAFSIGLDLDRDHLTGVLVDLSGTVRERVNCDLHEPAPEEALELLAETARQLIRRQGIGAEKVWGAGVGVPGPMVPASSGDDPYIVSPKAFPGWHNVPIAAHLRQQLGMPVFIENNATAAAIGERWYGAGQHLDTFFYVYFGSGLGGGLVVRGQPFEGFTGNAGELGYLPPFPGGSKPSFGNGSHVGELFNLTQVYAALQERGAEASHPDHLVDLLEAEHPTLIAWLDEAAMQLTMLLLSVEYLLDPEVIFLGGRLPAALLRPLMERARTALPERRIVGKDVATSLKLATAGADAAALGMATLPLYDVFAPSPRVLLRRAEAMSM